MQIEKAFRVKPLKAFSIIWLHWVNSLEINAPFSMTGRGISGSLNLYMAIVILYLSYIYHIFNSPIKRSR